MADIDPILKKLIALSKGSISPNNSFFDGRKSSGMYDSASKSLYHKYDQDYATKLTKVTDLVKKLGADGSIFESIKDCKFLKPENLRAFNGKQLDRVHDYLCKCNQLGENYNSKVKKLGASPAGYLLLNKLGAEIDGYKAILGDLDGYLLDAKALNVFNVNSCAETIESLHLSKSATRDMEIVRALEFTGTSLKKTFDASLGRDIWQIDYSKRNEHGLPRFDENGRETTFTLDETQVNAFLSNYLNKSMDERNGAVVTPEGIFKLYLQEAFQGLKKDEKSAISEQISEAEKIYSDTGSEWLDYKNSTETNLHANAIKLALVDIYKENLGDVAENLVSTSALTSTDSNKFMGNRSRDRLIDMAENINELSGEEINNLNGIVDISDEYQEKIDEVTAEINNPTLSKQARATKMARLNDLKHAQAVVNGVRSVVYETLAQMTNDDEMSLDAKKDAISNTLSTLGTCDFLVTSEVDGKFQLDINKSHPAFVEISKGQDGAILTNALENAIEYVYNIDRQGNLDSMNVEKVKNLDSTEKVDESMQLTDANALRLLLEKTKDVELGKALESNANLNRIAFLMSQDNEFSRSFAPFLKNNSNLTVQQIAEAMKETGLENDLFTPEAMLAVDADNPNSKAVRENIINNAVNSCVIYKRAQDRINEMIKSGEIGVSSINDELVDKIVEECKQSVTPGSANFKEVSDEEKINAKKAYEREYQKISDYDMVDSLENSPDNANAKFTKQLKERTIEDLKSAPNNKQTEKEETQTADKPDVTIKKLKDLYPKFDDKGLIKKFKPFSGKMIDRTCENFLKMLESVIIVKVNKPSSYGPIKTEDNQQEEVQSDDKEEQQEQGQETKSSNGIPDYEIAQYALLESKIINVLKTDEKNGKKLSPDEHQQLKSIQDACCSITGGINKNGELTSSGRILRQIIISKVVGANKTDFDKLRAQFENLVDEALKDKKDEEGSPSKQEQKERSMKGLNDLINVPNELIAPIFSICSEINAQNGAFSNGEKLQELLTSQQLMDLARAIKSKNPNAKLLADVINYKNKDLDTYLTGALQSGLEMARERNHQTESAMDEEMVMTRSN